MVETGDWRQYNIVAAATIDVVHSMCFTIVNPEHTKDATTTVTSKKINTYIYIYILEINEININGVE